MTNKQKQCLLAYLGYYNGQIDDIWGEKSKEAPENFQRAYGLKVDGVYGDGTHARVLEVIATGETPAVDTTPETASGQPPDTGTWWDDIKYFRRSAPYIGCPCGKCGGFPVEPSEKLMRLAGRVREHFGVPMIPTSTVRCQAHNDSLKGSAKNSYHVRGKAMDFYFEHIPAATVLAYVQTQGVHYAYAIDGSAVHMDVS